MIFQTHFNMPWQNTEICIFDLSGRCIYHQAVTKPEDYQIDPGKQSKGVYFIEAANAERKQVFNNLFTGPFRHPAGGINTLFLI